ncbi:MAG TPA: hypothetical protein VK983_00250 [Candidatus Limnocylindrales bacterium]|nr:hypothetical protein [Candidatus Limnocylindrales bacterium]
MEKLSNRRRNALIATALSVAALSGCSVDSYLNDPSSVQCDGRRTKADLEGNGMATFIVHGTEEFGVATVQVRRTDEGVSVGVTGDVTGPPQQLEADGFTAPVPIVEGAELSAFGAGGAWVIDAREDSVVIQGTCDGM